MPTLDDLSEDDFIPEEKPESFLEVIGNYEVNLTGVWLKIPERVDQWISYSPFTISSVGHNIDNGEKSIELHFIDGKGRDCKTWLSAQDALGKEIVKLQGRGINFAEKKRHAINEYISFLLYQKRDSLPEVQTTNKNGWKSNNSLFVAGDIIYSENGNEPIINHSDKSITNALKPHGKIADWVESVKTLIQYNNVRFKCYAAMSAPILRLLNQQSFIVHNYDESSQGKSTMSNIAMSHIGDPKILENSANSTQTAAERLAETSTDLPLNLDETSAAKAETLKTIVYMLSNERGKSRGNRDSQLRESSTWKTVCLTTGEAPITSDSTFTGAKIRVIEIYGGIGAYVPEELEKVKGIYKSNGHLLTPFMQKLFEQKKNLQGKYSGYKEEFKKSVQSDSGMDTRLIDTFAAIATAGYILEAVYKDIGIEEREPISVVKNILKGTIDKRKTEKYGARALEAVVSWIDSKQKYFINECYKKGVLESTSDDDKIHDVYGWITKIDNQDGTDDIDEFVDILPSPLKKYLLDSGFNAERCLEDWREQKIIVCSPNHFSITQRHSFDIKRVIRFKKNLLNGLDETGKPV